MMHIARPDSREHKLLRGIVERAKCLGTYASIIWQEHVWDIGDSDTSRPHRKRRVKNLYFTRRRQSMGHPFVPYEQPFADMAKAYVRLRASIKGISFQGQTHTMIALRYLYDALDKTGTKDPTRLTRHHFRNALRDSDVGIKWTHYHVGKALQQISEWIDQHQLTRSRINFKNTVRCPSRGDGLDPESQFAGMLKMPTQTALDALADISNNPLDDNERTLLSVIDFLVVGGFRLGEALTLPLDCWVEAPAQDASGGVKMDHATGAVIMHFGIRYWPEKGGAPIVKWLPDIAVPLAKRAVDELTRLGAEARAAAKILEANPDRVPLPGGLDPDLLIDLKQAASIIGLKSVQSAREFLLKSLGLKPAATLNPRGRYSFHFRVGDIEKALLKRRHEIKIIRRPGGHVQMLSESLCVMFQNQFHASKKPLKFLPELIGDGQINDALGNDADEVSIFSVRGLKEPDGSPMRIKTHAFRHWINTLVANGGLSDTDLARWSGRRDKNQNAAYKHGTVEQCVSWAKEMIRAGKLKGPVSETYHSIEDPVAKEQFLDTHVTMALFTHLGVCVHDYAIEPCQFHLNCLSGCPDYLRTKGDETECKNITEVYNFHLIQLTRHKEAEQKGRRGAGNYVAHTQRIVNGAKAALAVDEADVPDGHLVKVFQDGKVRGVPLKA